MTRPNIILILADDMGYGDFGCFNYGLTKTPHLDALISEGVCLTQHYSASPLCAPARAALLTGRYPLRTGVIDTICLGRKDCLATREITLADVLRSEGYHTGCIGKWHSGSVEPRYHPNARGFDEFTGFRAGWTHYFDYRLDRNGTISQGDGTYLTDLFTDEAIRFVRRHAPGAPMAATPFFLHLAYNAPHGPLESRPEDLKPFLENGRQNHGVSHVYAMIKRMDDGIGRLMETLEQNGLRDNTVILFSSDNGPQFGGGGKWDTTRFNCGFRGAKGSVHEGGIRVPLVMRWPAGLEGGRCYHDLVHFTDWLPTLCHLAGASIPADRAIDGQNVLPALRGEGAGQLPQQRFWQWSRGVPVPTHNAAVRDGDWKLVLPGDELANTMRPLPGWDRDLQLYEDVDMHPEKYHGGVPGPLGRPPCVNIPAEPPLLYNLAADPLETTDLSQQHPEKVSRLKTDFENWFEHVEAERATIVDKPYYSQNSRA